MRRKFSREIAALKEAAALPRPGGPAPCGSGLVARSEATRVKFPGPEAR